MTMRQIIAGIAATTYLLVGAVFGAAMMQAIPATNLAGAAYIAVTWPAWLKGSPIKLPVPSWAFTFKDPSNREGV